MTTLAQEHDCLLLDLDGTVFRGDQPTPGSVDTLATIEPLPGSRPRSEGNVRSTLVATHRAPARMASAASDSCVQPVSGECPCTTAAGSSANALTGRRPTF